MVIKNREYGISDILMIPLKCAPVLGSLIGLQILVAGIIPTIQVVVMANFINTAISIVKNNADIKLIYPSLFAVVILISYSWISDAIAKLAQVKMELAIKEKFRTAVTEKRSRLSYKYMENHEVWDLISRVSKEPETQIKTAFINLLSMVSSIMQVAGILILLITQVWWATLLIVAFSVPLFILAVKSGKANYTASREATKYKRKYEYLTEVLTGREAVDERTLFGYGKKMGDIWHNQYEIARKIAFKADRKWFIKMKTGSLITALISILIVFVLLNPVLVGAITIGMFISLVNAVFGLVQMMSWQLTNSVDQLAKHREYLKDLTKFAALDDVEGANDKPITPPPAFQFLEFKDVRFKYPGTENYILNGLSFRMESGKHYAFVGINGSGKTTITKLLTGLYDDFEGDIFINGKSISLYSQGEIKAFFAVVYQDFSKYSITMKQNINIGNINGMDDVKNAEYLKYAIDRAGLTDTIKKLPQGLDTPLGKVKEGGMDVSGGEWQRIAMARAVINPAPLRILDEPTAALDPLSESRLYEEFEQISRDITTIFISHRLGSTKLAHEIFVIGEGFVLENGTHQQLMNLDGEYARMYESQRSWYQ